jgi:hypothetical protein
LPRINIDDELRVDPRFLALCELVGRSRAYGALCCLWEIGQAYWKKDRALIPTKLFEQLPESTDLIRSNFALLREEGVYCSGAEERWVFLMTRSDAGRLGGRRSAETRLKKYGTAIPIRASNSEAKPKPPNSPKPSSSSGSATSQSVKNAASFHQGSGSLPSPLPPPPGASAPTGERALPKKKKPKKPATEGSELWEYYATELKQRRGKEAVKPGAKERSLCSQLVKSYSFDRDKGLCGGLPDRF